MKNAYRLLPAALVGLLLALLPLVATAQILPGTLSAGSGHSVLLAPDGSLRTWGYNGSGQLGNGTATTAASSVQPGLAQVAAGAFHTLALRADGTLWA